MAKTKPVKIIAKSSDGKGYVTGKGKVISKTDIAKHGKNYTVNGKTTLESKKINGKSVPATKPNNSKKDNLSALPVKTNLKKAAAQVKKILKTNKKVKEVKSVKQLKVETKKFNNKKHLKHSVKRVKAITKHLVKMTDVQEVAVLKKLIEHWEQVNQPTKSEIVSTPTKDYEEILEKMKKVLAKVQKK